MPYLKNTSEKPIRVGVNGDMFDFPVGAWVEIDDEHMAKDIRYRTGLPPSTKHARPYGSHRLEFAAKLPEGEKVVASHKFIEPPEPIPPNRQDYMPHGKPRPPGQHPSMPYAETVSVEKELIWRLIVMAPDAPIKEAKKLGLIKKSAELEAPALAEALWNAGVRYRDEHIIHDPKLDRRKK